jgi:hypothetical protein
LSEIIHGHSVKGEWSFQTLHVHFNVRVLVGDVQVEFAILPVKVGVNGFSTVDGPVGLMGKVAVDLLLQRLLDPLLPIGIEEGGVDAEAGGLLASGMQSVLVFAIFPIVEESSNVVFNHFKVGNRLCLIGIMGDEETSMPPGGNESIPIGISHKIALARLHKGL